MVTPNSPAPDPNVQRAAQQLGESIANSSAYLDFLSRLKAVNEDPQVQKIGAQLRSLQSQSQWGQNSQTEIQEIERLSRELEALEVVTTYRQAEGRFRDLLVEVNQTISERIGVDFSANAKCGCCG